MLIGFIGRTKILFDTIRIFQKLKDFEIAFIWTCKDEEYYNFSSKKFKELAEEIDCPFINSSNVKKNYNEVNADIVISINFINIIPSNFIDKFKHGILNAHAGDLPRYKGNACPNWAILNSEKEITLTVHKMDDGLDSGPIILKEKFNLNNNTYIGEIYEWLSYSTPKLFLESVKTIINNGAIEQQKGTTLRTFPRKPEDSKLDLNATLDWNYRLIRASSRPFSGAFAYLNDSGQKVKIFEAIPFSVDYEFSAINGQIMERFKDESSFLLAVGNEVLKVIDFSINDLSTKDSYGIVCKSLRNRLT